MSSSNPDRTQQRRRLLKTAAGIPVVLTLPSGAALAASSGMCVDNSAAAFTTDVQRVAVATDSWVRISLQKYSIKPMTGPNVSGFTYNSLWYQVTDGLATEVIPKANGSGPMVTPVAGEFYYALAGYDPSPGGGLTGTPIIDNSLTGTQPVAGGSCWTSLTGEALIDPANNLLA